MSKAFTKEEGPELPDWLERPAPVGEPLITPQGRRTLEAELHALQQQQAPNDAARLERDRRIGYLVERLDTLRVVEPSESQRGRVFFGAHVRLQDEDGHEKTYQVVGPDELDVAAGKVTPESPLVKAMLGKQKGDAVTVARPKGPLELEIREIWYD